MTNPTERKVTANINLTLDGRYHGPAGPADLAAIVPYAITDVARDHLARIWENATTAVLGRRNAEGFLGFWPSVADDENAVRGPPQKGIPWRDQIFSPPRPLSTTAISAAMWIPAGMNPRASQSYGRNICTIRAANRNPSAAPYVSFPPALEHIGLHGH